MKKFYFPLMLALSLTVAGCATPHSMAKMEGQGTKRVFDSGFDTIWAAAIAASQLDDLVLLDANKATGYIFARRQMGVTTFGENIAIWVHGVEKNKTSVEVIPRRTGPPTLLDNDNWESLIFKSIARVLPG